MRNVNQQALGRAFTKTNKASSDLRSQVMNDDLVESWFPSWPTTTEVMAGDEQGSD